MNKRMLKDSFYNHDIMEQIGELESYVTSMDGMSVS